MELYFISGGDDIKIWDCNEFELVKQFNPHDQNISSICWSHDNTQLASVSLHAEGVAFTNMKMMGVSTLDCGSGCLCVDLNETSRYMLVGGSDGIISVWDVKSKKIRKTYKDHKGAVTCAKFNHNTSSIASGSETGEIILYNVITGQGCRPLTTPRVQAIKQVQYSKFKKALLGSVCDDGSVSLWDCNTRQLINTFPSHRAPATGLSFSPINDILLMSVGLDKRIACQDLQSKKIVKTMTADSPLTSIDTLHDGVTVIVGSTRGKIFQYDLRMSSSPVRTVDAHKSSVQCLRFQNEIQVETLGSKTVGSKQMKHRQLPVSPKSSTNKDVAAASHQVETRAGNQGYGEDVFSPLREGFHDQSSRETIEFHSVVNNLSAQNHTNSAADGYAGGVFSPLNDNTIGRSSSGLSPLAMNSYPSFTEQRNSSGLMQMDYNRINSQLHTSPRLNSYPPVQQNGDIQDGQPTAIKSANQNSVPTLFVNKAPLSDINNPSEPFSAVSQANNNQSSSQKQVAFATDDSDPYAFLTNSDSSDSHSPEVKRQCGPSSKIEVSPTPAFPRMHLDESPGSVSGGSNIESLKASQNPQTEGVSAESCVSNVDIADNLDCLQYPHSKHTIPGNTGALRTESRPGNLQLSKPLSGDMAVLANVVRTVVQEEFSAMKREIMNEVRDEIEERTDQIHRDIVNLQAEMLRQFQIHQTEMATLLQHYSVNNDMISEIERLKEENKRLKRIF